MEKTDRTQAKKEDETNADQLVESQEMIRLLQLKIQSLEMSEKDQTKVV